MSKEQTRIIGAIDHFDPKIIRGWAADAKNPKTPVAMELLVSDEVILEWENNVSRPDLADALKTTTVFGFEVDVSNVKIEDPHAVRVRAKGTPVTFSLPDRWSPYKVYIERVTSGSISGWAWNQFDPKEHVQLRLFSDSDEIGITTANVYRKDLESAGIGDGDHAFVLQPPHAGSLRLFSELVTAEPLPKLPSSAVAIASTVKTSSEDPVPPPAARPIAPAQSIPVAAPASQPAPARSAVPVGQKIDWRNLASQFFDEAWYTAQAPDAASGSKLPFDHWWDHGRHKGVSPHPLFDPAFYATQVGNAAIQQKDLFLHFLHVGDQNDADPHVCFSMAWYRFRYVDREEPHPWLDYILNGRVQGSEPNWLFSQAAVAKIFGTTDASTQTPLAIYLAKANASTPSPHPLLDLPFVLRHNKDLDPSRPYETFWAAYRSREIRTHLYFDPRHYTEQLKGRSLTTRTLADYVLRGEKEGLSPTSLFHPRWYRSHYERLDGYNSALEEFADIGERLHRHPCPGFDPRYYLERHPDVARAGQAPFRHFITAGQRERRRPHARLDLQWYSSQIPEEAKERALEYFLEVGRSEGHTPHPGITVAPRASAFDAVTAFLQPNPPRSAVVPGIHTVFMDHGSAQRSGVAPNVSGQAWLVDRFERDATGGSALTANRAKRWEPIARQYATFDENLAQSYVRDVEARFRKLQTDLPMVSVVMPTRNRASVLKRAIRSVLSQTHANLELIVVDDGSTDGTEKLLRTHFSDPRLIYVPIPASGVSAARNEGLRSARGEYIAYLDSDNYWEPRHLEIVLKALLLNNAPAGYSTLRVFNAAGTVVYRGDVFNLDALCRENYIDMNVYVHHRRFFENGLTFDEALRRCVDWDLILRISKLEAPLFVPIVGCNYIDDNESLERITTNELSGDFYKVCQRNINLAPHIVGVAPASDCPVTIVWPISNADWASISNDLWAAVQHVSTSSHELIIVNNGLSYAATNTLCALARNTRNVRVVNLWRTFLDYPAANLAASIAKGHRLLLWRSGIDYNADAIESFIGLADDENCPLIAPLVVDPTDVVVSELARVDYASSVFLPTLTGQSGLPRSGRIQGLVPVTSPVLVDREAFVAEGGFDAAFAVTFGLADFAARLLSTEPNATCLRLDARLTAGKRLTPASTQNEYLKELEVLKERWLGKLRINPVLPEGATLRDARRRPTSVINWNLLPDPHSGSSLAAPVVARPLVFALRCPAPNTPEKDSWGDYHYAQSMIAALEEAGHTGFIEFRDDWINEHSAADVVLHIRGIVDVKPVKNALNAMWIISHPDKINADEYAAMDVVFAAGQQLKAHLWQAMGVASHLLLQATDPGRFSANRIKPVEAVRGKVLFVGNSRLQPRAIVLDAVQQKLPLVVYGKDWDRFLPSQFVRGEYIENQQLGNWYGSASVVLNDHWQTMREYGIISNRIFDVVAAGRPVITDLVEGLDQIFGDAVRIYSDRAELPGLVESLQGFDCLDISRNIREKHSFKARVAEILDHLNIKKR